MAEHDDFLDHDMCPDCRGSGKYVGFNEVENCKRCEGAGWLPKGEGWTWQDYTWDQILRQTATKGKIE